MIDSRKALLKSDAFFFFPLNTYLDEQLLSIDFIQLGNQNVRFGKFVKKGAKLYSNFVL